MKCHILFLGEINHYKLLPQPLNYVEYYILKL